MSGARIRETREKTWLALALAWVAGDVDAIGYLVLFHLFTAHMSGNSVAMGLYLGQRQWGEALYRGFPIPMFVFGVVLSAGLAESALRRGARSAFAPIIAIEVLLLIAFLLFGSQWMRNGSIRTDPGWAFYLLAALPAIAMGIQSATLRRVGGQAVHTTYVTGMLTHLAEAAVAYGFWLRDRLRRPTRLRLGRILRASPHQPSFNHMLLFAGIWSSYIAGAIAGGYTELRWGVQALVGAICALVGLIAVDLIWPIAAPRIES